MRYLDLGTFFGTFTQSEAKNLELDLLDPLETNKTCRATKQWTDYYPARFDFCAQNRANSRKVLKIGSYSDLTCKIFDNVIL